MIQIAKRALLNYRDEKPFGVIIPIYYLKAKYVQVQFIIFSRTKSIFTAYQVLNCTFTNYCYLTNRFHFAMRLYSDNAQMSSKRGENKEVHYELQASSVTDVLSTF